MLEHLIFIGVFCVATWMLASIWSSKKAQVDFVAVPMTKIQDETSESEILLSNLIEEADTLSRRGCVNVNIVRMKNGSLQLLSDFQLAVQKKDIVELVYSTDESTGNYTMTDAVMSARAHLPLAA